MRVLHILDISVPVLAGYTSRSRYIVLNQKALGIDPVVLTSVRQENPTDCSMEELDGIRYYRTHPPAPGLGASPTKVSPAALRRATSAGTSSTWSATW